MAGRSDTDRVSEIMKLAAAVASQSRALKGSLAQLTELYDGYAGDAWANSVDAAVYTNAGIESNKMKQACNGAAAVEPLGALRDEIYHIEAA